MQVYKELEVTETNKPERKRDIATLRKMAKAVNEKKTEVRNEFMRPYTAFENNVKELIEIIPRSRLLSLTSLRRNRERIENPLKYSLTSQ